MTRTTSIETNPTALWSLTGGHQFLRLLRPQQWYKNAIVFVPLVFSGGVFHLELWPRALIAFAAFCLIASAAYCVNDVLDRKRDREHPTKRDRPVASGAIGIAPALLLALILAALGLALLATLDHATFAIGALWLLLQGAYNLFLKQAFLWDILTIAVGFVLRALAGTTAIAVGPPTQWLIVCTFLFAFYLGLAKRRHERTLVDGGNGTTGHRKVLTHYNLPFLDRTMQTATALILVSYALYASLGTTPWMLMTLPFALYGILRHNHQVLRADLQDDAAMIFHDRATLLNAALWLALVLLILAGIPQATVAWFGGL